MYLNSVEVVEIAATELHVLVPDADVDAAVQLPERLLPRIGQLRLFRTDKFKATRRRVEQRQIVLVHVLIQPFPKQSQTMLNLFQRETKKRFQKTDGYN